MPVLIILGILICWCVYWMSDALTPPDPPVKDWDRFYRESCGKSPREIRRMHRSGKY